VVMCIRNEPVRLDLVARELAPARLRSSRNP
jgi:hypothetical protein